MAALPLETLLKQLPQQHLAALYVLHGEEDLLRLEALDALRAATKAQGYLNREVYTPEAQADWDELLMSANSIGLFSDLKLLEIHVPTGKVGKQGGDALQQLAQHLPEDTCCVLVLPKLEKAQISSKWFTALSQVGQIVEAKAVGVAALPAWIRNRLVQHQLNIEADALTLFAERVEGNLLAAKQEIDKLALLYPAGHTINETEAAQAVANVARFDVFQLSAAWMSGDGARVLRLLEGLEAEGEEPVLLLWAVSDDIRTLIRLAAALKQGQTVQSVRNSLRLWGDKQQLAPQAVRRIDVRRLLDALQECAKIDRMIKGAADGNAWVSMKHLLASLAS
ncbi:MAG: DNA polymerase III subunit delta [Neisseria sp.]|nr:DNA polymerase III subunit delta [Neisseria sp.]